nr:flagellar biosynthetic protein FliR [Sphingobium subterraneum]
MVFTLLFARVGAMLMLLPAFSDDAVPGRIRLFIALGVAAGLVPLLGPRIETALLPIMGSDMSLARMLLTEMLLGVALGLIVRLMFQAIIIAGSLISLQVGLTSALVNDPSAGGQVPLLARFVSIAALLICMASGVHHLWIAALVESYGVFPVGTLAPVADFAQLALSAARGAMALGLSLAAPLIVYGIIFNSALGLAARLAPALQIFFIAQPLNLLLGLALTAVTLAAGLDGFAAKMAEGIRTMGM